MPRNNALVSLLKIFRNIAIEQPAENREQFISRRSALKAVASNATALSLLSTPPIAFASNKKAPRVAIVGGGIAGLNAAFYLNKMGVNAKIFEAKNRLGGRIFSKKGILSEDTVTDLGAAFINSDHTDILALVKEFKIELFNRNAPAFKAPEGFYFNQTMLNESSVKKDIEPIALQMMLDVKKLEDSYGRFASTFDSMSVEDYFVKHRSLIKKKYILQLFKNGIRSEYGVELRDCSLIQLLYEFGPPKEGDFGMLAGSDEMYLVKNGTGQIIQALESRLEAQLRFKHQLKRISKKTKRFVLEFSNGDIYKADYVVLALPNSVLRSIELDIPLNSLFKQQISEVGLGRNEKFCVGLDNRSFESKMKLYKGIWSDQLYSQVWDSSIRQQLRDQGALTFYLGGNQVEYANKVNPQLMRNYLLYQIKGYLPEIEESLNKRFLKTNWTNDRFAKGAYTSFKPGQYTKFEKFRYTESEPRNVARFGNVLFAGEHLSDEFYGFMNGAAQTGRMAAEEIIKSIRI